MPNLLDLMRLNQISRIAISRQERIKREGSPYYNWTPGAINAGASSAIHVQTQFPESRKYEPLDWLEIVNMEGVNTLTVQLNGNDQYVIPASSIRTISGKGIALWHIKVTNNGAVATTAGKVVLSMRKEPVTIDDWARQRV